MNEKNIVQTAASSPQFSTLVALVKKAGLAGCAVEGQPDRVRTDQRRLRLSEGA